METNPIYSILISFLSGEATEEEKQILENWLEASQENRQEFEAYKRLYDFATSHNKSHIYDQSKAWEKIKSKTVNHYLSSSRILWWKYAAAIVVLVVSATFFLMIPSRDPDPFATVMPDDFDQPTLLLDNGEQVVLKKESFSIRQEHIIIKNQVNETLIYEDEKSEVAKNVKRNRLVVPRGTQYKVILSDGTKVSLNSESILEYPTHFTGKKREVTLTGEGYFEVVSDPEHPFWVRSEHLDIRVTGTVFNLSCYPEDRLASAVLVEGKVTVISAEGQERTMLPSQLFSLNKEKNESAISIVNPADYTSWLENKYKFKNAPLQEIMTRLQRWHNYSYSFEEELFKEKCFTITVDRDTALDQLLEVLNFTYEIQLEKNNNHIYIKRKEV